MTYAKRRIRKGFRNFARVVADLTATLADNERLEILREPYINPGEYPDTMQFVIRNRDTNEILDCYEMLVPRLTIN